MKELKDIFLGEPKGSDICASYHISTRVPRSRHVVPGSSPGSTLKVESRIFLRKSCEAVGQVVCLMVKLVRREKAALRIVQEARWSKYNTGTEPIEGAFLCDA
jgi:hypothetical protein